MLRQQSLVGSADQSLHADAASLNDHNNHGDHNNNNNSSSSSDQLHSHLASFTNHYSPLPPGSSPTPALAALCSAPYHLPRSSAQTLLLLGRVHSSLEQGSKHLVVSSMHPGGTIFISDAVHAMARDIGADVQSIDYQSLLEAAAELGNRRIPWTSNNELRESKLPGRSHEASDSDNFSQRTTANLLSNFLGQSSAIRVTNLSTHPDSESIVDSKLTAQYSTAKIGPNDTHYDMRISDASLESMLASLRDSIVKRFRDYAAAPSTHHRKLIIYVKDTTDMLESRGGDGRKVLLGLMDLTRMLRQDYNVPVLLVAGCSPSIANTPNLEKDPSFYSTLADGSTTLMDIHSQRIHTRIWADNRLFATPLDNMSSEFEKLELMPPMLQATTIEPAVSVSSNKSVKSPTSSSDTVSKNMNKPTLEDENAQSLDQIISHVESLQHDQRVRIHQINWKNIEAVCKRRRLSIRGVEKTCALNSTTSIFDRNKSPPDLIVILSMLERCIWPISRVEKLVNLAVGCRLEVALRNGLVRPTALDISAQQFMDALRILYQTDFLRIGRDLNLNSAGDSGTAGDTSSTVDGTSHRGTASNPTNDSGSVSGSSRQATSTAPAAKNDTLILQELLQKEGHRLNTYEKHILSTVVNPVQQTPIDLSDKCTTAHTPTDNIKTGFSDLVLPAPTKLMLQTLVTLPMLRPEFFQKGILSRSAIHGVLLFGPPGTGKTMLAKAVAKSSGARFMNVALSDVFDKYVGEGEKNVRAIFTLARKISPCVIFLDEVDALFASRSSDGVNTSRREIMNEFMAEWDGLGSNNNGVVVLGATNRPFDLDDAILRRMPRRVLIDLPEEDARASILRLLLREEELDSSVSIESLAKRTKLYSGSDLKNLCVSAALARVKEVIMRDVLRSSGETSASQELVASHLKKLDDWSSCLRNMPQPAPSHAPASSIATARVTTLPPAAYATTPRDTVHAMAPESVSGQHGSQRIDKIASLPPASETAPQTIALNAAHFEAAFAEVPPSLTDEMQTLVQLRKWDENFGDGAAHRRKNKRAGGWGFNLAVDTPSKSATSNISLPHSTSTTPNPSS
eukprot:jgi/Hompol1/4719/HPOL_001814-RA